MNWLQWIWPTRPQSDTVTPPGTDLDLGDPTLIEPAMPTVAAADLWVAWHTNVVDAEDQLGGRPIRIVGRVERVERRSRSTLVLNLAVDGRIRVIGCRFDEERRGQLAGVRPGDTVAVIGTVKEMWAFECTVDAVAVQRPARSEHDSTAA